MKVFRRKKSAKDGAESNIENENETSKKQEQWKNKSRNTLDESWKRREESMATQYKEMCMSLEQFRIDSRKYDSDVVKALGKYLPSVELINLDRVCIHPLRRSSSYNESEGDGRRVGTPFSRYRRAQRAHSEDISTECVYPVEQVALLNEAIQRIVPAKISQFLRMDSLDRDVPYWRTRSNNRVLDVHELLGADAKGTVLSPYCKKYLELASYIPPLAVLCKATIKNIISPKRKDSEVLGQMGYYVNTLDFLFLPYWLDHESLSARIPPAARYQLLNIVLSQNCNNNHPVTASQLENNHMLNLKNSKCPSSAHATSIPDDRKAGRRLHVDPHAILRGLEKRKTERCYLAPIGSCSLQGLSKGAQYWVDVASIIHQGTYTHKNLDSKSYPKQAMHTTLPSGMLTSVLVKNRLYSVRPIKMPMMNLKRLLDENASSRIFAETHAKFVAVNLLLALQFLHTHDVFHGSICPKKIIFNDKGYPCLTGFGTSESIDDRQGRPRERTEIAFTSPEQLYYEYLTELTDIWSLGAVVYTMVYGKPPHQGEEQAETRRNISNRKFVAAFGPEEMSTDGKAFISKCIRKDERRRFSILHMKRELFETIPWFARLNEDKLYRQVVPSPILNVINSL